MRRSVAFIELAVGLVALVALGRFSAVADSRGDRAVGYDHVWHAGRASSAGKPALDCEACHDLDPSGRLRGRPDHKSCFTSCHQAPSVPGKRTLKIPTEDDALRMCTTCHAAKALTAAAKTGSSAVTVEYPPYENDPDHGIKLSHAAHDGPTSDSGDCATCHVPPAAGPFKRPGGHALCARCHARPNEKNTPAMNQCTSCHPEVYGPRTRPHLVRGSYPVNRRFSHQRHFNRGGGKCRTCHGETAKSRDNSLPVPNMDSCSTCHNGEKAFSVVSPSCRRCHTRPTVPTAELRAPVGRRYDHRSHRRSAPDLDCEKCHALSDDGMPKPPASDHTPCSNPTCHRAEFSAKNPTICGSCHLSTEPWRSLHFDRPPADRTEFGARFSHRAHLGDRGMRRECTDCHRSRDGRRDVRLPRDHRSCAGTECHGKNDTGGKTGAAPPLSECQGCHVLGSYSEHEARRIGGDWSVRVRFSHRPHRLDPRLAPRSPVGPGAAGTTPGDRRESGADRDANSAGLPCLSCHRGVKGASALRDIPTPAKATCQPCHDGEIAFKITGHACARCHGKTTAAAP